MLLTAVHLALYPCRTPSCACTGFEYAQIQAIGQSSPPKTSDSRHRVRMASNCGWFRWCAIFSGRMCTSQNRTMSTTGTRKSTRRAMTVASLSSSSGDRSDAWALGGSNRNAARTDEPASARAIAGATRSTVVVERARFMVMRVLSCLARKGPRVELARRSGLEQSACHYRDCRSRNRRKSMICVG